MIVFMLFHFFGSLLMGISTLGFGCNLLCYLCGKEILFTNSTLLWMFVTGAVVEIIGAILGIISIKKGN